MFSYTTDGKKRKSPPDRIFSLEKKKCNGARLHTDRMIGYDTVHHAENITIHTAQYILDNVALMYHGILPSNVKQISGIL